MIESREPICECTAIYFISPSEMSVDALIRDFDKNYKSRGINMYKYAIVYFTSRMCVLLFFCYIANITLCNIY